MNKISYITLMLLLISPPVNCQSKLEDFKKKYTKSQLQHDFNQLIKELEEHPTVNEFVSKKDWSDFIELQSLKIKDSMRIEEFYQICMPIVAKVGCGHTNLYNLAYNSAAKEELVYLPYKMFIENEKLYAIKNLSSNHKIPSGSEILSINGKPIKGILSYILSCISADGYNQSYKRKMASKGFTYYYHAMFGINDRNELTYWHGNETKEKIFYLSNLIPSGNKKKLSTKEKLLNFRIDREIKAGIIQIKSFSFYNNVSYFESFIDSAFTAIKEENLGQVIIDLRGNQGGDPYCSSYLLRALASKPITYYKDDSNYPDLLVPQKQLGYYLIHKPYILIDGFGFSTTGHLAALIKQYNLGIFVGEELGSTYSCNGSQRNVSLKNTKLFLQVAQKVVDVKVDDSKFRKGRGILPDIEIKDNLEAIMNKQDIVLQKVIEIIKSE